MRGKTARRLRKLARRNTDDGSTLYQKEDGSIVWDGLIRVYRDLKKAWKNKKWNLNKGV